MTDSQAIDDSVESDGLFKQQDEDTPGIKFKDWGFRIDRLFEVAYRFYKRNESKAFHLSFNERNQLNALILQARYGNFDGGKCPDIGVLDLVGKNRRHQWSLLKGMSKMEAKSKFICTLDSICPYFEAYAEAVKLSSGIQTEPRTDKDGQERSSAEQKQLNQSESNDQLNAIRNSLQKQTYNQFRIYAEKQCPDDATKQKYLITTLQEQYYQQYISQMHPQLNAAVNESKSENLNELPSQVSSGSTRPSSSSSNNSVSSKIAKDIRVQSNMPELASSSPNNKYETSHAYSLELEDNPTKSIDVVVQSNNLASFNKSHSNSQCAAANGDTNSSAEKCSYEMLTPSLSASQLVNSSQSCDTEKSHFYNESLNISALELHRENSEEEKIGSFEPFPEPKPIKQFKVKNSVSSPNIPNRINFEHRYSEPSTFPVANSLNESSSTSSNNIPFSKPSTDTLLTNKPLLLEQTLAFPAQLLSSEFGGSSEASPEQGYPQDITDISQQQQSTLESHHVVETWPCDSSSGTSSPLQHSITYDSLEAATLWTKKGVQEFKDSLTDDKQGGAYIVKQGTLLIIQVPTYPDGKFIYWEFVTDDYDIGFGLDFVYEPNIAKPLALKIYEESDEDDEEELNDIDSEIHNKLGEENTLKWKEISEKKQAEKIRRLANTTSIVPTYRRESHEEVFVGRHRYPGQGYYLLKFDNTYSVLRSKSLFFRICYFI